MTTMEMVTRIGSQKRASLRLFLAGITVLQQAAQSKAR